MVIIIIIIIIFIHTRSTQILVTTVYTSLENTNVCQIDPQGSNYKNINIITFLYYFLIAEWLLCYVHLILKTRRNRQRQTHTSQVRSISPSMTKR